MAINFNKIRELNRKNLGRKSGDSGEESSEASLDPFLTYISFNSGSSGQREKWQFKDGKIQLDDEDLNQEINKYSHQISFLSHVSHSLNQYRDFVWGRGVRNNEQFNGAIQGMQEKVLGRMGNMYDGLTCGVHFELESERLWINNIDVRSVINLYRLRPTVKARMFLKGLYDKLALILGRRHDSKRYHGVHAHAEKVFSEIAHALAHTAPADNAGLLDTAGTGT